jgi:hypothetical protein
MNLRRVWGIESTRSLKGSAETPASCTSAVSMAAVERGFKAVSAGNRMET